MCKNAFKGLLAIGNALVLVSFVTGCEEDEVKALAKAQKCMDQLPVSISDWEAPLTCANFVSKYNSQQANIIKCAAYLTGGGLDTARIVSAAKTLDDGDNQEAVYIAALTLNKPDNATGLARATTAKDFCNATGVGAYEYLGNLALMGTTLSNIGTNFPADPTQATPAQIEQAIDDCVANPTCVATIADSAETIAASYCADASETDDVCTEINEAIESAGGDTAQIGEAMLCLLKDGTWANSTCTLPP